MKSVIPSPYVPKYTQLFDHKADFTGQSSGERFTLSGDFHVNSSAVQFDLYDSQGGRRLSLFLWCGAGQSSSLLLLTNFHIEIRGKSYFTSFSCLPPCPLEKLSALPNEAAYQFEIQGFTSWWRLQRLLCQPQHYPH